MWDGVTIFGWCVGLWPAAPANWVRLAWCSVLQYLLQVLLKLSQHQAGNRLPSLDAQDALAAAALLAGAALLPEQQQLLQQRAQETQQPLQRHPGVQLLCQSLLKALPQVDAQQQLQLLEHLAALAQVGLGELPASGSLRTAGPVWSSCGGGRECSIVWQHSAPAL